MNISEINNTMAFITKLLLIAVYTASVSCHSAFVDTLPKCKAWDYDCQKNIMQSVLQNIGTTGIHDLDIIPIDPLDITGFHIPVFDLIDLTITKGNVKGIKDCRLTKFMTDIQHGLISVEGICDIFVEANYGASSYNPLVTAFLGTEALHGEGSGHVKIEKLKVSAKYPFHLVRRDHDLYINSLLGNATFTFDVLGKVQFYADKGVENDHSKVKSL